MIYTEQEFIQACLTGELSTVKSYLKNCPENIDWQQGKGLINAAQNGHLKVVKYLLTSPDLTTHSKIQSQKHGAFRLSARFGHLETVEYLLTSPELTKNSTVRADNDYALRLSAQHQQWHVVKYLLTSPALKKHANIHAENDMVMRMACHYNHTDMIEYLLESPELKEHIELANNYYQVVTWASEHVEAFKYVTSQLETTLDLAQILLPSFMRSISRQRFDILEIIIFELNFPFTDQIDDHLKGIVPESVAKQIYKMFSNRELQETLANQLSNKTNNITDNRKKI